MAVVANMDLRGGIGVREESVLVLLSDRGGIGVERNRCQFYYLTGKMN
jgi:hypothetical protein